MLVHQQIKSFIGTPKIGFFFPQIIKFSANYMVFLIAPKGRAYVAVGLGPSLGPKLVITRGILIGQILIFPQIYSLKKSQTFID